MHPSVLLCRERYKFLSPGVTPEMFAFERILGPREGETNIPEIYDARLLARKDPSRLRWIGDKTPNYVRRLNELRANNPGARFILTYRPVEEVAESYDARAKDPKDPWLQNQNGFRVGVRAWNLAMRNTHGFLESGLGRDVLIIGYHDFFYENETCIPLVSRFLDLEFDESIREAWREMSRRFEAERKRDKTPLDEEQAAYVRQHADRAAEERVLWRIREQWENLGRAGERGAALVQNRIDELRIERLQKDLKIAHREKRRLSRRTQTLEQRISEVRNSRAWRLLDSLNRLRAGATEKAKAMVSNRRGNIPLPVSLNNLQRKWIRSRPDAGNTGRVLTTRASTMLVSFCNVKSAGKPFLALVDLRGKERRIRWIEIKKEVYLTGATGLCFWNDLVCVAHQGGPGVSAGFVIVDPASGFKQVSEGSLPLGVHSVCSRNGDLYFAVSRRDSIFRAKLNRATNEWKISRYWTLPGSSGSADENHVNAIGCVHGELCVSGFEQKESDTWDSATRGFIYNVDKNEYVMRGVNHPHSLLQESNTVWTCESRGNRLISTDGEKREFPSSYLRGLAIDRDYFYAGSSKRRVHSESTGKVNPKVEAKRRGSCCVYRSSKESGRPRLVVDFSEVRDEIYDILLF